MCNSTTGFGPINSYIHMEPYILCIMSPLGTLLSLSLSYFQKFILQSTLNIQFFSFCNLIKNWHTYANEGENVTAPYTIFDKARPDLCCRGNISSHRFCVLRDAVLSSCLPKYCKTSIVYPLAAVGATS